MTLRIQIRLIFATASGLEPELQRAPDRPRDGCRSAPLVDDPFRGYNDKQVVGSPVAGSRYNSGIEIQCWRGVMNINELAKQLGDACYAFLAVNFLFGVFQVIVIWRRIRQLRFRRQQAETEFTGQLETLLNGGQYDAAIQMCDYDYRALPRLCLLMLANRSYPYDKLRQTVAESMQRDILADLEYRLSWIATVIKNGPLLGLFGTVLGMMASFGRIGTGEKVQPSVIAEDISIALICTAMGLATAIPLGYILSSLTIRVRVLQESLGSGLSRILEHFRHAAD